MDHRLLRQADINRLFSAFARIGFPTLSPFKSPLDLAQIKIPRLGILFVLRAAKLIVITMSEVVPSGGFEPPILSEYGPKPYAYTNSATRALSFMHRQYYFIIMLIGTFGKDKSKNPLRGFLRFYKQKLIGWDQY